MDFMNLVKSIEQMLYELVSWLLFYPLTLWRIIRHPTGMMEYAEKELVEKGEDQFSDTLSPPILLMLTLIILHLGEGLVGSANAVLLPGFLGDDRNLLIVRAVGFSLFPLLFAAAHLRARHSRLNRRTLKPAFYSQSYATVPFVLAVSLGMQITDLGGFGTPLGLGLLAVGACWYLIVQTMWFARDPAISLVRAIVISVVTLLLATILLLTAAVVTALTATGTKLPIG